MWCTTEINEQSEENIEHPAGADRGGYGVSTHIEAEIKTSYGGFYLCYDCDDYGGDSNSCEETVTFTRGDRQFSVDPDKFDFYRMTDAPGDLENAADQIFEDLKEEHPDLDQDFNQKVVDEFLERFTFDGLELWCNKIRVNIGDHLIKRKKVKEDKLESFIFRTGDFYYWHKELTDNEEVQQAWSQIVAQTEAYGVTELKEQIRSNKLEGLVEKLNRVFNGYGDITVEDALEATKACFVGRMMAV